METKKLNERIIERITKIDDIGFLNTLNAVVESGIRINLLTLTDKQAEEIISSSSDMERGMFIENKILKREVRAWLKAR